MTHQQKGQKRTDSHGLPPGPLVGIWWNDGRRCAVLAHPPTENASGTDRIDSNLAHVDEWPSVAADFGKSAHDEYFSVPRGRVVIERASGRGIIFHGPATTADRLKVIADRFQLVDWEAQLDTHYFTGPDADALFED